MVETTQLEKTQANARAGGAYCPACGTGLMSFGQHLRLMKATTTCPSCGAQLRQRHIGKIAVGAVLLGLLCALAIDYFTEGAVAWLVGMLGLVVVAIGAEYLYWRSGAGWEQAP